MMKRILLILTIGLPLAFGQSSKDLLRDGLFAEESEGDLKTATEKYEALLKAFAKEKKVAAVALYRLAAVKRKQGDDKGALALYEEFAKNFGTIEPQATLVRENYLTLSGKELLHSKLPLNEEDQDLAELKKLAKTSPDLFPNLKDFSDYAAKGSSKIIAFLLEKGADPNHQGALAAAANSGNLSMVKLLTDAGADPNHKNNLHAIGLAIEKGHWQVAAHLGKKNADIGRSWPGILSDSKIMELPKERLEFLMAHGADPNYIAPTWDQLKNDKPNGIPLHDAVILRKHDFAKLLLESGSKVDLARATDGVRALHLACWLGDEKMIQLLISAGADLNAPTQAQSETTKNFPKRYRIGRKPISPIQAIDVEKAPILVEAGAKIPAEILIQAVHTRKTHLVDYFISKGAEVNQQSGEVNGDSQLPIDGALANKDEKMVDHLISKGAKLSKASWWLLWPKHRIQFARESKYPELAKNGKVTLIFPELSNIAEHTFTVKPGPDLPINLLKLALPTLFRAQSETFKINYDRLDWNLVRSGNIKKIDLRESSLPEFGPGDIIEITGFDEMAKLSDFRSVSPKSIKEISSRVSTLLRKAARFPVKITYDGTTHDMLICPDKVTFDARGNELPAGNLGQILNLVMAGSSRNLANIFFDISVTRSGFPKFSFGSDQGTSNRFELQAGDHIQIAYPKNIGENGPFAIEGSEKVRTHYRKRTVTARVPGKLGEWRWGIHHFKAGNVAPTLLALIADLNSANQQYDAPPHIFAFEALSRQQYQKVLPGIDLDQIVIHRLEEAGEQKIELNLSEKINDWNQTENKERPFDFQLQAGDIVDFSVKPGAWTGFSEATNEYFEAALNFPLILVNSKSTKALSVNFKLAKWHQLDWGYFPMADLETKSSIRGDQLVSGQFSLKRNGNNYGDFVNLSSYWPMAGDIITMRQRQGAYKTKPRPTIGGSATRPTPPRPPSSNSKSRSTATLEWPKAPTKN